MPRTLYFLNKVKISWFAVCKTLDLPKFYHLPTQIAPLRTQYVFTELLSWHVQRKNKCRWIRVLIDIDFDWAKLNGWQFHGMWHSGRIAIASWIHGNIAWNKMRRDICLLLGLESFEEKLNYGKIYGDFPNFFLKPDHVSLHRAAVENTMEILRLFFRNPELFLYHYCRFSSLLFVYIYIFIREFLQKIWIFSWIFFLNLRKKNGETGWSPVIFAK